MRKKTTTATTFAPRIRFNWGFWDAVNDAETGRRRKFPFGPDAAYKAGYESFNAHRSENPYIASESAWADYKESK